jgi:hypothetical protein
VTFVAIALGLAVVPVVGLLVSSSAGPDYQRLVGHWERNEGGYRLELAKVSADGGVEATYLNPTAGPIHVAQARAERDGESIRLTVELRDRGYDGSTYTLSYDAQRDELHGKYRSVSGEQTQEFDVTFTRMK